MALRTGGRMILSRFRYTRGGIASGRGDGGGESLVQPCISSFRLITKGAIKKVIFKTTHYLTFNIVNVYSLLDNG